MKTMFFSPQIILTHILLLEACPLWSKFVISNSPAAVFHPAEKLSSALLIRIFAPPR